jgi:heterodisulfide reductase subunit B
MAPEPQFEQFVAAFVESTRDRLFIRPEDELLIVRPNQVQYLNPTAAHILDVLYHDVGVDQIRGSLERRLDGLHAVVQYPCHTLFPSEVVGFDSPPARPHVLGELVEALGATVDHYSCEYSCCGGAGGFHRGAAHQARDYARRKFDAIKKETKADLIVVSCITCLMYMDKVQTELTEDGREYAIPVFDYNQLLALCQGQDARQVACISEVPRESVLERISSPATRAQVSHRKE